MSRREAYGYAVARIRAMEHRLLDANLIQRLVDSEDVAAVFKILGETAYAKNWRLCKAMIALTPFWRQSCSLPITRFRRLCRMGI